ncbi:hypothetical protein [Qipengyuania flava]|nr:hypothetical protein [Qipengyuania flava]
MDQKEIAARLDRFEDWTREEVAHLLAELAEGTATDATRRFDGYWGAAAAPIVTITGAVDWAGLHRYARHA